MRKFFLFLLAFTALLPRTIHADILKNYIRVECNSDLSYLLIHRITLNGVDAENAGLALGNKLFDKYSLVDADALITYDKKTHQQSGGQRDISCTLKDRKYNVHLGGYVGNPNPEGMCGGWNSVFVSVTENGKSMLDEVPLEQSCQSEKSVSQILILYGQYMTVTKSGGDLNAFEDDLPVSAEKIYGAE